MSYTSSVREFILDALVQQTKEISEVNSGKYIYQAFALEAVSIELLGKVLSGNDLFKYINGQPRSDFENAIETLFPARYHEHKTLLYEEFRCGMLHTFGPKSGIALGESEEHDQVPHLSFTSDGKLILLFKEFHHDFKMAASMLFRSEKVFIQNKLNEPFIRVDHQGSNLVPQSQ